MSRDLTEKHGGCKKGKSCGWPTKNRGKGMENLRQYHTAATARVIFEKMRQECNQGEGNMQKIGGKNLS